jgi:hypothetical protein
VRLTWEAVDRLQFTLSQLQRAAHPRHPLFAAEEHALGGGTLLLDLRERAVHLLDR